MARISVKEPVVGEQPEQPNPGNPVPAAIVPEPSQSDHQPTAPASSPWLKQGPLLYGVCVLVALVLVGAFIMLVNDRRELKQELARRTTPQANTVDEAEQLKSEVGQFMELPADETPTVATVTDASKVKSQSFFANAQNGDKVLLFAKAGKAILYRPTAKKIIEVSPIDLNQTEQSENTAPPGGASRR